MGFILRKTKRSIDSKKIIIASKDEQTLEESTLYRPISEFSWKDASKKEIRKEAIESYSVRFSL